MDARTLETSTRRRARRIVGALLLVAAPILAGCRTNAEPPKDPSQTVAAEIETPLMDQYRGGALRWRMWGEKADVLANGNVRVRAPKVLVYEAGEPSLTVTGNTGEIVQSSRDFRVVGNVNGVSKHALLRTDELLWNDRDDTLTAPNESEIRRGSSVLTGRNLTGRPSLETFKMKQIRATLYPEDETIEPYKP